ncbi:MAG: ferrochelatase [Nitriliruptoraceae bacterium]
MAPSLSTATTSPTSEDAYDAVLLVSFGGPEAPDDVLPFLERVTSGRNIPRERLEEVAEHYFEHDGRSPINDQNRALLTALRDLFDTHGPDLPIYWGNRNWHPFLADTLRTMRDDGVKRALCFVTSAFSSYSGCRQYREDLAEARAELGDDAPALDKIRVFYNHPGFVSPMVDRVREGLARFPSDERDRARIVFVTHSIPHTIARHSDYEAQHVDTCRAIMHEFAAYAWDLVYCSRSGPPHVPWLEPDINDHLQQLADEDVPSVLVVPVGFVSDHMEVIHDLDVEAAATAAAAGLTFVRAGTVGVHPTFVAMIRELVLERHDAQDRACIGLRGPSHDVCPIDCCAVPEQQLRPTVAGASR